MSTAAGMLQKQRKVRRGYALGIGILLASVLALSAAATLRPRPQKVQPELPEQAAPTIATETFPFTCEPGGVIAVRMRQPWGPVVLTCAH